MVDADSCTASAHLTGSSSAALPLLDLALPFSLPCFERRVLRLALG